MEIWMTTVINLPIISQVRGPNRETRAQGLLYNPNWQRAVCKNRRFVFPCTGKTSA